VLKESLIEWLSDPAVFSRIRAFSSATGGHGGVGATYVLLRD
jgi:DNA-nicking Smr family endonuclease